MNLLSEKPHLIFWLSIPLIIIVEFLRENEPLDFNIHDSYYVISRGVISILISLFFGIIGLGYWLMQKANKKLSKWMNWIHIFLTFGGIISITLIPHVFKSSTASEFSLFDDLSRQYIAATILVVLVIFSQLIYLTNLIIGLFNKNKVSS